MICPVVDCALAAEALIAAANAIIARHLRDDLTSHRLAPGTVPPSEANLADFSLLRLLPRKDRVRRRKGQGHHVLFGVINVVSSASRALPLLPQFRTYRCVALLGDQIG